MLGMQGWLISSCDMNGNRATGMVQGTDRGSDRRTYTDTHADKDRSEIGKGIRMGQGRDGDGVSDTGRHKDMAMRTDTEAWSQGAFVGV